MTSSNCPSCSSAIGESFRFCPKCGERLGRTPFRWSHLLIALVLGVPITWALLKMQGGLAGERPTVLRAEFAEKSYTDPTIERLRAATKASPDNVGHWRALGEALGVKYTSSEAPAKELTFELVHVLGEILKREPEDGQALITMANISFNSQAFDKAAEYYERYLKLAPQDDESRIHYSSALTFLGRYDEAESNLRTVISNDPTHFQAHGLLAVTFAARGDAEKADEMGKAALRLAPTEEARARMREFLEKVAGTEEASTSKPESPTEQGTGMEGLRARLTSHSILGPKLSRVEKQDGTILIVVRDFPMASMPPFAKEKFFSTIRGFIQESALSDVESVVFQDDESKQTLETLSLLK